MTHTYKLTGMTCMSCVAKVKETLSNIQGVEQAEVSLDPQQAKLDMVLPVPLGILASTLSKQGSYTIEEWTTQPNSSLDDSAERVDFKRLFPLFLVFAFIIGGVVLRQIYLGDFNIMEMMVNFMGLFFIVFSFFKFLDIKGFASSFSSYDPITQKLPVYGYIYPFIELGLGISYLFRINLVWTNLATLVIIGIGTYGVIKAVTNKQEIQCACLGTVFNLPMTKVTLTENSIMLVMAVAMLVMR